MARERAVLISELSGSDATLRSSAAEALARLGDDARGAAVPLVRVAGDTNDAVREWVIAALEGLGPPSASDVPALVGLLSHDDPDVAYWAATLLGRLDEQAAAAVSALCAALDRNRPLIVRERAAWALGRIGAVAGNNALVALKQAAADSQPRIARLAQRALDQISR